MIRKTRLLCFLLYCFLLAITSLPVIAEEVEVQHDGGFYSYDGATKKKGDTAEETGNVVLSERSFGYRALVYLPNRILDLFDVVRLRARVGPGIGVGLRMTRPLSLELVSYNSVYLGLPGPRRARGVNWPIGIEQYNELGIDFLEPETNKLGPDYAQSEVGVDAQLLLVGASVSVDYKELLDFFTGFIGIEVVRDDI